MINGPLTSTAAIDQVVFGRLKLAIFLLIVYINFLALFYATGEHGFLYASNGLNFCVALVTLFETSDLFHPFTMIPLVHGLYSTLPLISYSRHSYLNDRVLETFGIEGGGAIFSAATLGIIITWLLLGRHDIAGAIRPIKKRTASYSDIPSFVPWMIFGIALILNIGFFSEAGGFSAFSSLGYLERFQIRLTPGMGILVYGQTLNYIALALFLSEPRINVKGAITCFSIGVLMFLAHGSRSFFIIPGFMCAAAYHYRIKRLPALGVLLGCAAVFVFSEYVAFTRDSELSGAPTSTFAEFFSERIGVDEFAPIYGTASAAYEHYVEALPGYGDYLWAWQSAIPQFLMTPDYTVVGYRFAWAFDPESFESKMAWGFSVFGEAYLVLGIAGPTLIAMVFCGLAAWLYRQARIAQFSGRNAAIWFTFIFFQNWLQRNAFATIFRDWFVFQAVPITLALFAAKLLLERGLQSKR